MDERLTDDRNEGMVRFFTYLPNTDDLALLILKGHLLIEEQLISILEESVRNVNALNAADLKFYKRLQIAKALKYEEENDWVWTAVEMLNTLRNELAHKIDSPKVKVKLTDFLVYMVSIPIYRKTYDHRKDEGIISHLRGALAFLCGVLDGNYLRK